MPAVYVSGVCRSGIWVSVVLMSRVCAYDGVSVAGVPGTWVSRVWVYYISDCSRNKNFMDL